jgi:hypothetical protein
MRTLAHAINQDPRRSHGADESIILDRRRDPRRWLYGVVERVCSIVRTRPASSSPAGGEGRADRLRAGRRDAGASARGRTRKTPSRWLQRTKRSPRAAQVRWRTVDKTEPRVVIRCPTERERAFGVMLSDVESLSPETNLCHTPAQLTRVAADAVTAERCTDWRWPRSPSVPPPPPFLPRSRARFKTTVVSLEETESRPDRPWPRPLGPPLVAPTQRPSAMAAMVPIRESQPATRRTGKRVNSATSWIWSVSSPV